MEELADRLHRNGVLGSAGHGGGVGRRARVDGEYVVRHGRTVVADHPPALQIQAGDGAAIEPRPGHARERPGVDMRLVIAVMAGDQPRQHAGIGRVHLAGDQRQPDAGKLFHGEPAEHLNIGVPRAHQHDVLDDRLVDCLHGAPHSIARRKISSAKHQAREWLMIGDFFSSVKKSADFHDALLRNLSTSMSHSVTAPCSAVTLFVRGPAQRREDMTKFRMPPIREPRLRTGSGEDYSHAAAGAAPFANPRH